MAWLDFTKLEESIWYNLRSETIQFLATYSPLKMMKNAYFTSKALFDLNIFKSLLWLFGHASEQLD